jgi:pantoate--beta-alanine ligase
VDELGTPAAAQRWSGLHRKAGQRIGFVPTMGALHAGHLHLVDVARKHASVVVVSIFVNPIQFNQRGDFDRYPRPIEDDRQLLAEAGVDALYVPAAEVMYPPGFQTHVDPGPLAEPMEGTFRPGHFRGVATVVTKLFNIIQPDRAYFGQKDAQQTAVIRRLVRDLSVPVEIRVVPTVRDEDGLALSSRNVRLSPEERERALALPRALATQDPERARELLAGIDVDYLEIADFDPPVLAAAVRVGETRLIDNVVLEGDQA